MRLPLPTRWALYLALPVVAAVCFQHLLASPGALLVDGARPSIDYADRGGSRGLGNDLTTVFLPRFVQVEQRFRAGGSLPLWDPSGFGGRPMVGNPQAGLFYPPYWVAVLVGHPAVLGWLTFAHLIWAGVGVVRLARALGLGRVASVFAGACYEASPYLIGHAFEGHYPHVWSASWHPWAFWALILTLRREPLGVWALPPILALSFLTGHPQEWYLLVLALTAWVLADVRGGSRREKVSGVPGALHPTDWDDSPLT